MPLRPASRRSAVGRPHPERSRHDRIVIPPDRPSRPAAGAAPRARVPDLRRPRAGGGAGPGERPRPRAAPAAIPLRAAGAGGLRVPRARPGRLARPDLAEGHAVIPAELRAALAQEGSAAFVTQGPGGPHLVATWNSYLRVLDDETLAFPAGGARVTEQNVRGGSGVQMILGAKTPRAVGFRLT